MELVSRIDRFYSEELANFLERMKEAKDMDGKSLLHNTMVVWGSGLSDGHWHTHVDLPIVVPRNAGGRFQPGRHVDVGETPLNNLFVRMLGEVGMPGKSFGDSTGSETRV